MEAKEWYENIFTNYLSSDVDKKLVDRVQRQVQHQNFTNVSLKILLVIKSLGFTIAK